MDSDALVSTGQTLVNALDKAGHPPRLAMWVHTVDIDSWKLWIVPSKDISGKSEFYRVVATAIMDSGEQLAALSTSDTEFVPENHPAAQGMWAMLRIEGIGAAHVSGNRLNGYYLPEGIVIRSVG